MDQLSSESIVLIVCSAAIGTLFAACSAGLGWLLNRGVKRVDRLADSHGNLKDQHGELKLEQAVLKTKVEGHGAWLQDHELVINEWRRGASAE